MILEKTNGAKKYSLSWVKEMKKIVTYGKHKKREIHVNVRDKFDEISDDDNEAAFTSFVYNHRNGW